MMACEGERMMACEGEDDDMFVYHRANKSYTLGLTNVINHTH